MLLYDYFQGAGVSFERCYDLGTGKNLLAGLGAIMLPPENFEYLSICSENLDMQPKFCILKAGLRYGITVEIFHRQIL